MINHYRYWTTRSCMVGTQRHTCTRLPRDLPKTRPGKREQREDGRSAVIHGDWAGAVAYSTSPNTFEQQSQTQTNGTHCAYWAHLHWTDVISLVPRAGEGMSVVCLFIYKYLIGDRFCRKQFVTSSYSLYSLHSLHCTHEVMSLQLKGWV